VDCCARLVPAARLELARLAAADFESATSTDFVTRAARANKALIRAGDYHMGPLQHLGQKATIAIPQEPT
jgi:hypothetical protein